MQAPRRQFLCPKFEIEPLDMAGSAMQMVPAPHVMRPLQEICCSVDASGLQQLERLEKDLEQAKQKLLVLRAQGHQESLQSENKVKFSQRVSESRYWTNEERQRFKKALKTFGTDFAAIAKFVGTRSSTQVRTHAQKYYAKLIRDYKRSGKAQAAAASGVKDKSGAANARIATESSYIRCSQ
ncbi:myb-like protein I [Selaginella moellendorffii]|uniref:myb-like protein I n=1 Tax=Selaginella moellendorffii TaxID=88036 RepID=UPI000D1D0FB2|nr:myb-like protein I [Selaginella moellendorffii]|eukprot:XP_024542553.1 myb-like protein I [Selaginella moellendorffii]